MSSYEMTFEWPHGGSTVIVTGTFDQWSSSVTLTREDSGKFSGKAYIPWGEKIAYKFIVDGQWVTNISELSETDPSGNVNNIFAAPHQPKEPASMTTGTPQAEAGTTLPSVVDVVGTITARDGTSSTLEYVTSGIGAALHSTIGVDPFNANQIAIPTPRDEGFNLPEPAVAPLEPTKEEAVEAIGLAPPTDIAPEQVEAEPTAEPRNAEPIPVPVEAESTQVAAEPILVPVAIQPEPQQVAAEVPLEPAQVEPVQATLLPEPVVAELETPTTKEESAPISVNEEVPLETPTLATTNDTAAIAVVDLPSVAIDEVVTPPVLEGKPVAAETQAEDSNPEVPLIPASQATPSDDNAAEAALPVLTTPEEANTARPTIAETKATINGLEAEPSIPVKEETSPETPTLAPANDVTTAAAVDLPSVAIDAVVTPSVLEGEPIVPEAPAEDSKPEEPLTSTSQPTPSDAQVVDEVQPVLTTPEESKDAKSETKATTNDIAPSAPVKEEISIETPIPTAPNVVGTAAVASLPPVTIKDVVTPPVSEGAPKVVETQAEDSKPEESTSAPQPTSSDAKAVAAVLPVPATPEKAKDAESATPETKATTNGVSKTEQTEGRQSKDSPERPSTPKQKFPFTSESPSISPSSSKFGTVGSRKKRTSIFGRVKSIFSPDKDKPDKGKGEKTPKK